ncbi:MAG: ATP-binding cassette domain-containing protein [Candidatus Zixiibacteriota bacterium]
MGILEINNLSLELGGKKILDDLTIDFWEGHVHAVVGINGAGKSTLANTIMGLSGYRDFEGDILFNGKSLKKLDIDKRSRMGITMAWQEPARFEGLSVFSFIKSGAKDKTKEGIKKALEQVGLSPDKYLFRAVDKTLSGGERKKVELASILAMEPKLAILDEPDSGIDIESIHRIFDAVGILKEMGATVLLITHSEAVLKQAEHAFLLCNGKLMEKGNVDKIMVDFGQKCKPCDHKNQPDDEFIGGAA